MARCPFYGCRWPERSRQLQKIGGNECALDLDHHGPCYMEAEGRNIDFFCCAVADRMHNVLRASDGIVLVPQGNASITLADWRRQSIGTSVGESTR